MIIKGTLFIIFHIKTFETCMKCYTYHIHIHNGNILSIVSQNIHRSGNEDCALSSSCMNLVRILACITLLVSVEGGDEWAAV